jgi:hypothetical protein
VLGHAATNSGCGSGVHNIESTYLMGHSGLINRIPRAGSVPGTASSTMCTRLPKKCPLSIALVGILRNRERSVGVECEATRLKGWVRTDSFRPSKWDQGEGPKNLVLASSDHQTCGTLIFSPPSFLIVRHNQISFLISRYSELRRRKMLYKYFSLSNS